MSVSIPPVAGALVGTNLTAAINDRLRRIQVAFASLAPDTPVLPQLILSVPGTLAVNANAAPLVSIATDATPTSIVALVKTAPTGSALKFTVKAGGAIVGGGSIAAGSSSGTMSKGLGAIAAGAVVTLAVTAVGATLPGSDLTVMLRFA
jgi:hypothetical protein